MIESLHDKPSRYEQFQELIYLADEALTAHLLNTHGIALPAVAPVDFSITSDLHLPSNKILAFYEPLTKTTYFGSKVQRDLDYATVLHERVHSAAFHRKEENGDRLTIELGVLSQEYDYNPFIGNFDHTASILHGFSEGLCELITRSSMNEDTSRMVDLYNRKRTQIYDHQIVVFSTVLTRLRDLGAGNLRDLYHDTLQWHFCGDQNCKDRLLGNIKDLFGEKLFKELLEYSNGKKRIPAAPLISLRNKIENAFRRDSTVSG